MTPVGTGAVLRDAADNTGGPLAVNKSVSCERLGWGLPRCLGWGLPRIPGSKSLVFRTCPGRRFSMLVKACLPVHNTSTCRGLPHAMLLHCYRSWIIALLGLAPAHAAAPLPELHCHCCCPRQRNSSMKLSALLIQHRCCCTLVPESQSHVRWHFQFHCAGGLDPGSCHNPLGHAPCTPFR